MLCPTEKSLSEPSTQCLTLTLSPNSSSLPTEAPSADRLGALTEGGDGEGPCLYDQEWKGKTRCYLFYPLREVWFPKAQVLHGVILNMGNKINFCDHLFMLFITLSTYFTPKMQHECKLPLLSLALTPHPHQPHPCVLQRSLLPSLSPVTKGNTSSRDNSSCNGTFLSARCWVWLIYIQSAQQKFPCHTVLAMCLSVSKQKEGREEHWPSLVLLLSGILECKEPDLQLSRARPHWHTCKQSGLKMASTAILCNSFLLCGILPEL